MLHGLFHSMLRNVESRQGVLLYVAALLKTNEKRTQLHSDEAHLARDGFMLNTLSMLQKLSLKIRLERIDLDYPFREDALVAIEKETKLRFDSDQYNAWLKSFRAERLQSTDAPNFPTQCWFLTLHMHHVAIMPAIQRYNRRLRAIKEFQRLVAELNSTRDQWEVSAFSARNKEMRNKWLAQIKKLSRSKACYDIGLLDQTLLRHCLVFYSSVCEYVLNQMEGGRGRQSSIAEGNFRVSPPLLKPSGQFSALPEWYLEDISDFLLFCMQYVSSMETIVEDIDHSMITWLLTSVCAPQCIKNPYVTAKLVEVLFVTSPTIQTQTQKLHNAIMSHEIAQTVLVSSLMRFYVDIETTGQSTEFYDKFTIRYHISHLFKGMWDSPVHRQCMINESRTGKQFVKFVNMLMNDTTFLLDECLEYLKRIHETQVLVLMDPAAWAKLPLEQQQARTRQLAQDERQCRSYLTLARETVDMFHYLTVDIKEPFLRPELVDRLSAMLNYNLHQLCGPKCKSLKVRSPAKYGWEPPRLLGQIIDIYLHLDSDVFAAALAADEVSVRNVDEGGKHISLGNA